ncbi:MAG: putative rane protein [Acidobacteria bacterium]|nr:putative rane protein [Acidobacteriota bacterium]
MPTEALAPPDATTRLGGWLFRHRTSLPLPVAIAILTLRIGEAPPSPFLAGVGVGVTVIGELVRLWGVHHIGAISRTRSERLGPLVASGPFALVRNPLYVGNIGIWVGFALTARLIWLAPVILVLLALEYHAIVRWEETLLESRLGQVYRDYAARVPRWLPRVNRGDRGLRRASEGFSWRATLFTERGTFIAIALGYVVLWLKVRI